MCLIIHLSHHKSYIRVTELNCSIQMVFYRVIPKSLFLCSTQQCFCLYFEVRFFQPLRPCHPPLPVEDPLETDRTILLFAHLINLSFCRVLLNSSFFTDSTQLTTLASLAASSINLSVLLRYHVKLFFLLLTVFRSHELGESNLSFIGSSLLDFLSNLLNSPPIHLMIWLHILWLHQPTN